MPARSQRCLLQCTERVHTTGVHNTSFHTNNSPANRLQLTCKNSSYQRATAQYNASKHKHQPAPTSASHSWPSHHFGSPSAVRLVPALPLQQIIHEHTPTYKRHLHQKIDHIVMRVGALIGLVPHHPTCVALQRFALSFRGCGPCRLTGTFVATCTLACPFRVQRAFARFVAALATSVADNG